MSIKLQLPKLTDLKPRITVLGVGGAGCNAINNMIGAGLEGVDFVVANTDAQALATSSAEHRLQLGVNLTEGLGAGSRPEIGEAAAEEAIDDIRSHIAGSHMVFIAAGMGGGTGTGAAGVIARVAKELGILTVGIVTKPFHFEGARRMRIAEVGIAEVRKHVDTLIVIPTRTCSASPTRRRRLPRRSCWPTRCSIRASPALSISSSARRRSRSRRQNQGIATDFMFLALGVFR